MTEEEIHTICKKYNIKNYQINPDMSIDVSEGVVLSYKSLSRFPLKFNKVGTYFSAAGGRLTTLEGCPSYIGEGFSVHENNLTDLQHAPKHVGESFCCSSNPLTTLKGLPVGFYIGEDFIADCKNVKNPVDFSYIFFGTINGQIKLNVGGLIYDFVNKNKNPSKKDLPRLLSELRKITI